MSLPTLIILWVIFCILHSGLIAASSTRLMQRLLREHFRWFRLGYNILSLIATVALVMAGEKVGGDLVFAWSGGLRIIHYLLLALGISLFVAGAWHYDLAEFIGIRQVLRPRTNLLEEAKTPVLKVGLHGLMRHPWYTAVILLLWSSDLTTTTLAVNIVLSVYVVVGTLLEERKLVLEFGQLYRDYQRQVSMFVPWLWLKNSLKRKTA